MTKRDKLFREIKSRCVDLIETSHYDHCVGSEDECSMSTCPELRKCEENFRIREEAQCPTCGSIVAPHEIEMIKQSWSLKAFWKAFGFGVLGGAGLWVIINLWIIG